jgi:hypothetical protein
MTQPNIIAQNVKTKSTLMEKNMMETCHCNKHQLKTIKT